MSQVLFNFLILFIVFFTSGCAGMVQNNDDTYKIAVIAPLSGPYKFLGRSIVHGAELAIEEKNKKGGINGKEIKLIQEDDGGLIGEGAFFAYKLSITEGVLGIIGHLNSDISIPASDFYSRAMIVQISPGSTSPHFTQRADTKGYVFRTIGRDDTQGKIAAEYVLKNNFKRVAILYNERIDILAGEFAKSLKSLPTMNPRPSIVYYNMIEVGRTEYGALLSQLSSLNPDVIFLAGEHNEAGNLIKDFPKYGLEKTQFIGSDGIDNNEFIMLGGINTEGTLVVRAAPIEDKSFIDRFKTRFGEEPTGYAANSYDAANIIISAIEKVKENNPEKVAKEVAKTMDFMGATGTISFNENGDLNSTGLVLSRIVKGEFKVIE